VPGAVLHIVGDGTMRDLAERLVRDLPAQTEWSELLTAEEVSTAMDDAWLVALPSRSEGLPRVALEAACRGRAIIGGNRAGIPDVVRDEVNGLLIDPEDADALSAALVRILSDRAFAERLGAAARATGEEWGVTPGSYSDKVVGLVQGVLAG
jgi:glycosyltransferase involved in cell wall biosynthesis